MSTINFDSRGSKAASCRWATLYRPIAAILAYRAYRRARKELHALDDRTLKDIGLARGEIDSVLCDRARDRIERGKWR